MPYQGPNLIRVFSVVKRSLTLHESLVDNVSCLHGALPPVVQPEPLFRVLIDRALKYFGISAGKFFGVLFAGTEIAVCNLFIIDLIAAISRSAAHGCKKRYPCFKGKPGGPEKNGGSTSKEVGKKGAPGCRLVTKHDKNLSTTERSQPLAKGLPVVDDPVALHGSPGVDLAVNPGVFQRFYYDGQRSNQQAGTETEQLPVAKVG